MPLGALAELPVGAPEDAVRIGDEVTVVVTEVDRERRRLSLSRREARPSQAAKWEFFDDVGESPESVTTCVPWFSTTPRGLSGSARLRRAIEIARVLRERELGYTGMPCA